MRLTPRGLRPDHWGTLPRAGTDRNGAQERVTIALIGTLVNNEWSQGGQYGPLREGGMLLPTAEPSIELVRRLAATTGRFVASCTRGLLWPWLATPGLHACR